MSGWVGSGGAPPDERDAAVRDSLLRTVSAWRDALRAAEAPGDVQREASRVRAEAASLRGVALAQGWSELAGRLHRIELCAEQAPASLTAEVDGLVAEIEHIPPARAGSAAPPGLTVRLDPRAAELAAFGPRASALPSAPVSPVQPERVSPPVAIHQPGPAPSAAARTIFGLRGFGRPQRPSSPPASARAEEPSLLKLRALASEAATPAPQIPWAPRPARPSKHSRRDSAPAVQAPRASAPLARRRGFIWLYAIAGGAIAIAMGAGAMIALWPRASRDETPSPADLAAKTADAASSTQPVASAAPSPVAQITALIHQIGEESEPLRALIDAQGRSAARCLADTAQCGLGYTTQSVWALRPLDGGVPTAQAADGPLPTWLRPLRIPNDFPLHDDAALRQLFDYDVRNIEGRQRLEGMLFKCSAYEHIFNSTLQKYGAPAWLTAVVYQESGCSPRVKSPVGAMGLWQFMPESARAYGLKVIEDEVDERLNPMKSTEAAVHMLTDLERKFGAWDLALAAYNMGPFALTVRLEQVGGNLGFWQLSAGDLLPDETARYVPAIEAFALVLQNRSHLGLPADGPPLESTAEVIVKPGTRLSFIARAAHTSTAKIRDLNPEFLHDAVPQGETTARVPDSEAHRAQEFLDAPPGDDADKCVPETFDWGREPFATSPYAARCAHGR